VTSRVAIVELKENVQTSFERALRLIGKIDDLNTTGRSVVVKVGVFDHKKKNHPTISVVQAIVNSFGKASRIYLVESDNYKGNGSERLQLWKEVFNERVAPFNLSDDMKTKEVKIADEKIGLSDILFKPNVFVSTHVLRKYEKGTILKNLLGLIPDRKKVRFHKKLETTLLDAYEAIGGIDLAVIDGTYTYSGPTMDKRTKSNILLVGRDAVAVETVGAVLVGSNPEEMPVIREAVNRGLGEGDVKKIRVLGDSIESLKNKFHYGIGFTMFHPRVKGTYYEMGYRYGAILYKHGFRVPEQPSERLSFGKACEKEVKRVFPQILEEVHGFADACHGSYEHLAALILSVGAFKPGSSCSVFAAFSGSDVVFGRNYDMYYRFKEHSESYLTMPSDGYWSVGNTDIFVGREDGVNEKGLAIGMNFVSPRNVRPGINFPLLLRCVLDECANVEEGVKVLTSAHHVAADNYLLADREGKMAVVEACPDKVRVRKPEGKDNFIVSTNHFVHPEMSDMENAKDRPLDSTVRYTTIYSALKQNKGKIQTHDAQKILSDHKGYVCSHAEEIKLGTLWSIVATLKEPRIYSAEGHPCRTGYREDTRLKRATKKRRD